jgi:hypothetical protein
MFSANYNLNEKSQIVNLIEYIVFKSDLLITEIIPFVYWHSNFEINLHELF